MKIFSDSGNMTEMHLDLCIQSTTHLLQTVSNIKENIRILEVFLNSGLTNVDFLDNVSASFINGEYNFTGEDKSSVLLEQKLANITSRHLNCCCMCRFRQNAMDHDLNGNLSRASAATASISSNPSSMKKSRPAPPMPRLNKTASLRRETVLQRQRAQEMARKIFL